MALKEAGRAHAHLGDRCRPDICVNTVSVDIHTVDLAVAFLQGYTFPSNGTVAAEKCPDTYVRKIYIRFVSDKCLDTFYL